MAECYTYTSVYITLSIIALHIYLLSGTGKHMQICTRIYIYIYIYVHQVVLTHLSVRKLCGLAEMQLLLTTGVRVVLVLFIPADKRQRPLLRQLELGTVKGYAGLGRLAPRTRQGVRCPVWQESIGARWDIHRAWVPAKDSGKREREASSYRQI